MADVSPSHDLSIRPVLFLGFLVASAPTALLFALRGGATSLWYGPAANAVLCFSNAVLAAVIATWLGQESKLSRHPALAVLTGGYVGLSVIFIAASFIHFPVHMAVIRIVSMVWTMTFGSAAVVFVTVKKMRQHGRVIFGEHPLLFHSFTLLLFAWICLGGYWLDGVFHSDAHATTIRRAVLLAAVITTPIFLAFTFRIYLRRRNSVILFFSLSLYLYTLAVLGQIAGPEWSLPWWFSQGMSLVSAFTTTYGILEASRLRDRMALIDTLAESARNLQKSHEDLAWSETRHRSLVNNAPCGIFRLGSSKRFEAVNPALLEILGYATGTSLDELPACSDLFRDSDGFQIAMQELKETGRLQDEVFWERRGGTTIKVRLQCRQVDSESLGAPSYEGIVEDLSAQSSLEEQLRQSQKMEAIGRLAGGIAHDFNNLLTIINGYSGMLIDTLSTNDPRRDDAERIKNAAQRAAALTRQLLAFSRKQVLTPTMLNLNTVISDFSKMLPRVLGEDIDMAFIPGKRLASAYADRGQVEQVLMNLIVNARDAMPEGGKITVETKNEKLDEKYIRHRRDVIPGEYVMLAVTDTGCGMDAGTQARIFEPFFTTKGENKGSGLGLATAYGIVKQSGGHITVYSEPGQGTTFKVFFPATSSERKAEKELLVSARASRGGIILVVEDEDDLRRLIVRALCRLDYQVLEACTGEEAVEIVQKNNSTVHLLITDIVLPGIGGARVAQVVAALVPNMKVLFMSGYTDNAMFHQKLLNAGSAFIQKPFTLDALEEKVAKILEARETVLGAKDPGEESMTADASSHDDTDTTLPDKREPAPSFTK